MKSDAGKGEGEGEGHATLPLNDEHKYLAQLFSIMCCMENVSNKTAIPHHTLKFSSLHVREILACCQTDIIG